MNKKELIEKLRKCQAQYKFGTPKYDAYGQSAFFAEKLDALSECEVYINGPFAFCGKCRKQVCNKSWVTQPVNSGANQNYCPNCGAKFTNCGPQLNKEGGKK